MFFFLQKSIFVDIFFSFNPNRVMGINGGHFPAICRVCSEISGNLLLRVSFIDGHILIETDKINSDQIDSTLIDLLTPFLINYICVWCLMSSCCVLVWFLDLMNMLSTKEREIDAHFVLNDYCVPHLQPHNRYTITQYFSQINIVPAIIKVRCLYSLYSTHF